MEIITYLLIITFFFNLTRLLRLLFYLLYQDIRYLHLSILSDIHWQEVGVLRVRLRLGNGL